MRAASTSTISPFRTTRRYQRGPPIFKLITTGAYIYYCKKAQRAQSGVHRTPRGGESRINTGWSSVWVAPLFGRQRWPSWKGTGCYQVDMLVLRYESVNFGVGKRLGSPIWWAEID